MSAQSARETLYAKIETCAVDSAEDALHLAQAWSLLQDEPESEEDEPAVQVVGNTAYVPMAPDGELIEERSRRIGFATV